MAPRTALIAVTIALALPAASHAAPNVGTIHTQTNVAAGKTTFTVTCPKGYAAASGTWVSTQGKSRSSTAGPTLQQWSFGVLSVVPTTVSTVVRCVKIKKLKLKKGVGGVIQIPTVTSPTVAVQPGATTVIKLKCPKGNAPAGAGLQVGPSATGDAHKSQVGDNDGVRAFESMPVRGGWQLGVQNTSAQPQQVDGSLRCLDRVTTATGKRGRSRRRRKFRHRFTVTRKSFDKTLNPGGNLFAGDCPRGTRSIAVGWKHDPSKDVLFHSAFPDKKRELHAVMANSSGAPVDAKIYGNCLTVSDWGAIRR